MDQINTVQSTCCLLPLVFAKQFACMRGILVIGHELLSKQKYHSPEYTPGLPLAEILRVQPKK